MTIIKVNLHDDGISRNNLSGYNNLTDAATTGVRFADLLDSSGLSTGVSLTQNGAFTGDLGASTIATSSPDPDFEFEFFNAYFYAGSSEISGATFTMSGLPAGAAYTLKLSGASDNDARDTNFTATDGTPSPALYNNVTADPPTAPVEITGTVPVGGEVTISLGIVSTLAYINGWQIEYVEGGPSISASPSTVYPGESIAITGSGFGATQGTGGVTIGGVAQTVTAWSDTSITITGVLGNNSYGSGKTLEVTTDAAATTSTTIEIVAAPGYGYVIASSPNTTDESSFAYNTAPTVVTGDQFEYRVLTGLTNLVIGQDMFVTSVDEGGTLEGRFWDATDSTWGPAETFTVTADGEIDDYPFSKSIKYAATKNWTWGKRHPMTSMRVRIFK